MHIGGSRCFLVLLLITRKIYNGSLLKIQKKLRNCDFFLEAYLLILCWSYLLIKRVIGDLNVFSDLTI